MEAGKAAGHGRKRQRFSAQRNIGEPQDQRLYQEAKQVARASGSTLHNLPRFAFGA